jgi:hypothetical protein
MRPRLERSQRVVLVVGLALVCYVLANWLTSIDSGLTGWVGYAPLQESSFRLTNGGLQPWVRVVIWIFFIVLWVLPSLWLLRPARVSGHDPEPDGDRG